jgi:predicted AAA+ superfamily ATPase
LSPNTIREYYQILEDTLVGHLLPPFQGTTKRKPVATAKFYLFDVGVANSLRRTGLIERGSDAYGRALEHLVFLELRSYLDYTRSDEPLTFWRSLTQFEVDFVIHDRVAVEVKGKSRVTPRDYKGILALDEELDLERRLVVCDETRRRRDDRGVEILPVGVFLKDLWAGKVV